MAEVRVVIDYKSQSQLRISHQSLLLGVEIDTPERALLMKQGYIPMDPLLIHRYEDCLCGREEWSGEFFAPGFEA
jgi:hypothetical protein